MAGVVALLLVSFVVGAITLRSWHRQQQIERFRNHARLHVIEGQLAMLRAALRVEAAEHYARQRMHAMAWDDDHVGWHR